MAVIYHQKQHNCKLILNNLRIFLLFVVFIFKLYLHNYSHNPRKAELYLRKALYICEKYKSIGVTTQVTKRPETSRSVVRQTQSAIQSASSNRNKPETEILVENQIIEENIDEDELDCVPTILYDLASILKESSSNIIRKEAIGFMRRCLDMKIITLGANHNECQLLQMQLTDIEIKNANMLNYETQLLKRSAQVKPNFLQRSKSQLTMSPRDKTLKCLEDLRKQIRNEEADSVMDEWINRNSVMEVIMPLERDDRKDDGQSNTDNFQMSEYIDSNLRGISSNVLKNKQLSSRRVPSSYSATGHRPIIKNATKIGMETPHERACYMPSAFSIDIHNSATVHGPHSSIRTILAESTKDKTIYKPHSAIVKQVYYKSAWYDLPYGSSKKRFKHFEKLKPNTPHAKEIITTALQRENSIF